MCGEHLTSALLMYRRWGSSPHVRGTLRTWDTESHTAGIIPACAGNTVCVLIGFAMVCVDHPRMCGEHEGNTFHIPEDMGSSPHVRGTRDALLELLQLSRIIPACAGNTSYAVAAVSLEGDHPRMCGEHAWTQGAVDGAWGSSPHVRGTLSRIMPSNRGVGIIPACAGNTGFVRCRASQPWDHPRMCGEHPTAETISRTVSGSSPHVRGTP